MGLLDEMMVSPEEKTRAQYEGLLSMGLGILANNTSKNAAPALGRGGMIGMNQYKESMNDLRHQKMQDFMMKQKVGEIESEQQRKQAQAIFLANPNIPEHIRQGVVAGVINLSDLAKPQSVSEGATLVSPLTQMMGGNGVLAQGQKKPPKMGTDDIFTNGMWQKFPTVDGVPDTTKPIGSPFARGKDASNVSVNQPYEREFDKKRGSLDADRLGQLGTSAQAARSMMGTLPRMEQLNPSVYAGGGAGGKLAAVNFLQGIGVNVGDADKVAKSQEFDAIASKAVLDSLGGSLGAGTSNADVEFIKKTVPQLGHSAEARKSMMEFMRNKAIKQIRTHDSAQAYADKNGSLKGWQPEREVIRKGLYGGKNVIEYDDGSIEYAN